MHVFICTLVKILSSDFSTITPISTKQNNHLSPETIEHKNNNDIWRWKPKS